MSNIYDFIINGIANCLTILSNFNIGGITMLQFTLALMVIPIIIKLLITRVEESYTIGSRGTKARAKEISKNDKKSK